MQHGTMEIKVHSMAKALGFLDIVSRSRIIINLAISILWDATESEQQEILRGVELAAMHQYIKLLTYLTETHLAAKFDMHDGIFHGLIEARFPVDFDEQFLYAGNLHRFVLEIDACDPNYILTLAKILKSNPNLLEVMVQTKEKELLSQIVSCYCCIQPNRTFPIQFTFFDECTGNQERTVAKLVLTSKDNDTDQISGDVLDHHDSFLGAVNITVLEWAANYFSEAITNDEAAILDLITAQVPKTLISFTLDISYLTKAGIDHMLRDPQSDL
ncbi:hypothetical protein CPB97_009798 [Podila verticillata]|nr:hypothetical protein CPB97_009798 [Podila verticillata]